MARVGEARIWHQRTASLRWRIGNEGSVNARVRPGRVEFSGFSIIRASPGRAPQVDHPETRTARVAILPENLFEGTGELLPGEYPAGRIHKSTCLSAARR